MPDALVLEIAICHWRSPAPAGGCHRRRTRCSAPGRSSRKRHRVKPASKALSAASTPNARIGLDHGRIVYVLELSGERRTVPPRSRRTGEFPAPDASSLPATDSGTPASRPSPETAEPESPPADRRWESGDRGTRSVWRDAGSEPCRPHPPMRAESPHGAGSRRRPDWSSHTAQQMRWSCAIANSSPTISRPPAASQTRKAASQKYRRTNAISAAPFVRYLTESHRQPLRSAKTGIPTKPNLFGKVCQTEARQLLLVFPN